VVAHGPGMALSRTHSWLLPWAPVARVALCLVLIGLTVARSRAGRGFLAMVERLPDAHAPPSAGHSEVQVNVPGSVACHDDSNLSYANCVRFVSTRRTGNVGDLDSGLHGNQNRSQRPSVLTVAPGVQQTAPESVRRATRRRCRDVRLTAQTAQTALPRRCTGPLPARTAVAPCSLTSGSVVQRRHHERASRGSDANPPSRFAGFAGKPICPTDGV
jgi:hypothetical protein